MNRKELKVNINFSNRPNRNAILVLGGAALLGLLAGCDAEGQSPPPLRVWAASSLVTALPELAELWSVEDGSSIQFHFDATNRLVRQVEYGAPADLLFTADHAWISEALRQRLIEPSNPTAIAVNRLAVVVPRDQHQTGLDALVSGQVATIGLAGEGVPAGRYAQAALERAGVWPVIRDKVVRASNARATLTWAATGAVDAAVVYMTDATSERRVRVAHRFNPGTHPPIEYYGAVTTRTSRASVGRRFLDYCHGADAQALLREQGFSAPARTDHPL